MPFKYTPISDIIDYMDDLSPEDKMYFYDALSGKVDPSSPCERKGNLIKDKRDNKIIAVMDDYAKAYAGRISENVFDGASPEKYGHLIDSINHK